MVGGRGRGKPRGEPLSKNGPATPSKLKARLPEENRKRRRISSPSNSKVASDKSVRGKRKSALQNSLIIVAAEEEQELQTIAKHYPAKRRKIGANSTTNKDKSAKASTLSKNMGGKGTTPRKDKGGKGSTPRKENGGKASTLSKDKSGKASTLSKDKSGKASTLSKDKSRKVIAKTSALKIAIWNDVDLDIMQDLTLYKASNQEAEENLIEQGNEVNKEIEEIIIPQVKAEKDENQELEESFENDVAIAVSCLDYVERPDTFEIEDVEEKDALKYEIDDEIVEDEEVTINESSYNKPNFNVEVNLKGTLLDSKRSERNKCIVKLTTSPVLNDPVLNDPFEFKDSFDNDSNIQVEYTGGHNLGKRGSSSSTVSESTYCLETIETKAKEKMQRTLLVKSSPSIFFTTTNISNKNETNIANIKNLHPDLDYNIIDKIFFSYLFFVEASSEDTRHKVEIAFEKSYFDFALYCSTCAHATENEANVHKPDCVANDKNDLNKIAKILLDKYPPFDDPRRVLVVKRSRCIDLDEVNDIMRLSEHIVKINFGISVFLECKSVEASNCALKLLNEFSGHSLNREVDLTLKCSKASNLAGYQNYDKKENGIREQERNNLKSTLKTYEVDEGKERTTLLLIGPAVFKTGRNKSRRPIAWLHELMGRDRCIEVSSVGTVGVAEEKKNVGISRKSSQSDYSVYAVAFFKSEEDTIEAFRESQYIYMYSGHVNVVFMARFLQQSPSRIIKLKQTGKKIREERKSLKAHVCTKERSSEEHEKSKIQTQLEASVSNTSDIPQKLAKNMTKPQHNFDLFNPKSNKNTLSQVIPLKKGLGLAMSEKPSINSKVELKNFKELSEKALRKDPSNKAYLPQKFDTDSRNSFSGSEDDMSVGDSDNADEFGRRKSLPTSSLATTSFGNPNTSNKISSDTKFDDLLMKRKFELAPSAGEPPLTHSSPCSTVGRSLICDVEDIGNNSNENVIGQCCKESMANKSATLVGENEKVKQLPLSMDGLETGGKCEKSTQYTGPENDQIYSLRLENMKKDQKLTQHQKKIYEIEGLLEKEREENTNRAYKLQNCQRKNDEQKQELASLNLSLEGKQANGASLLKENQDLKDEIKKMKEVVNDLENKEFQKASHLESIRILNDTVRQKEEEIKIQLNLISDLKTQQEVACPNIEIKKEVSELQITIDQLKSDLEAQTILETSIETFKSENETLTERNKELRAENEKNQPVIEKLNKEIVELQNGNKSKEERIKSINEEKEGYREKCDTLKNEKIEFQDNLQNQKLKPLGEEVDMLRSKIDTLKAEQKAEIDIKNNQIEELMVQVESSTANIQEKAVMKKDIENKEKEVESIAKQLEEKCFKLVSTETELRESGLKNENLQKAVDRMIASNKKMEATLKELGSEAANVSQQVAKAKSEAEAAAKEKENALIKKHIGKFKSVSSKLADTAREINSEKTKNEELQNLNETLQARILCLKTQLEDGSTPQDSDNSLYDRMHKMTEDINKAKLNEDRLEIKNKQLNEENVKLNETVRSQEEKIKECESNDELKKENESLKCNLETAKEHNDQQVKDLEMKGAKLIEVVTELNSCKADYKEKEKAFLDKDNKLESLKAAKEEREAQHKKIVENLECEIKGKSESIQILEYQLEGLRLKLDEAETKAKEETEKIVNAQIKEVGKKHHDQLKELKNTFETSIKEKESDILKKETENSSLKYQMVTLKKETEKLKPLLLENTSLLSQISQLKRKEVLEREKTKPLQQEVMSLQSSIEALKADNIKRIRDSEAVITKQKAEIAALVKRNQEAEANLQNTVSSASSNAEENETLKNTNEKLKLEIQKLKTALSVLSDRYGKDGSPERDVSLSPANGFNSDMSESFPTLSNILNNPSPSIARSNILNYPNPPSLSPQSSISGCSKQGMYVKNAACLLQEGVNPFQNNPQRQAGASAKKGLLPNQRMKSRASPSNNVRVSTPNTSQLSSISEPMVQIETGEALHGAGRGGRGRGNTRGTCRNFGAQMTNNSRVEIRTATPLITNKSPQRRKQLTPIAPKASSGSSGNVPISEAMQLQQISQQEENISVVTLSSPESEEDQEQRNESILEELTVGLKEALEDAKSQIGVHEMELKYKELFENLQASMPDETELIRTALNKAFLVVLGRTWPFGSLDDVVIIEDELITPGAAGMQVSHQYPRQQQLHQQQQQGHNQIVGYGRTPTSQSVINNHGVGLMSQQMQYVNIPNVGQVQVASQQPNLAGAYQPSVSQHNAIMWSPQ